MERHWPRQFPSVHIVTSLANKYSVYSHIPDHHRLVLHSVYLERVCLWHCSHWTTQSIQQGELASLAFTAIGILDGQFFSVLLFSRCCLWAHSKHRFSSDTLKKGCRKANSWSRQDRLYVFQCYKWFWSCLPLWTTACLHSISYTTLFFWHPHAGNPTIQTQDSLLPHFLLLWTPHLEFTPTRP